MAFKRFEYRIIQRIFLIILNLGTALFLWIKLDLIFLPFFQLLILGYQTYELYQFNIQVSKRITLFLESIRYSDFISGFSTGNELGSSFKELNESFNNVLKTIQLARSEKEEHWQYLNIVVQHVNVGLISFDEEGNIGLINAAAKKLTGVDYLHSIDELIEINSRLYKALFDLPTGKSTIFKSSEDIQLSIHATEVRLRGCLYKLVALQNIQPELQKKEIEAWQNLTRILRHEIMNSITPIASLTSTLKTILLEEAIQNELNMEIPSESAEDIKEGLLTIESRSKGLIKFINAYRDYTTIPQPKLESILVQEMLDNCLNLLKSELNSSRVEYSITVDPSDLKIEIDPEQIEQVLINLLKNSIEAFPDTLKDPKISIIARKTSTQETELQIRDNGDGIIREALDKIFIPFYTTKRNGSGIGLALSRQIMQMHNGTISVESEPGKFTVFRLKF